MDGKEFKTKDFIKSFLIERDLKVVLVGLILFIFLFEFVTSIVKQISEQLFFDFESGFFKDITFIFLTGYIIFLFIKHFKKPPRLSFSLLIVLLTVSVYYLILRFSGEVLFYGRWIFAYTDLLLIGSFFYTVLYIKSLISAYLLAKGSYEKEKQKELSEYDGFLLGEPLSENGEDSFGRTLTAQEVIDRIFKTKHQKSSLAIGITGEWGSGKTSFLRLIKGELENVGFLNKHNVKETDFEVIDFNVWLSSTPKQIIKNFFDLLKNRLKKYDPGLSGIINTYVRTILSNSKYTIWSALYDKVFHTEDFQTEYDQLNKRIKNIDKKIIVFIDDFDRLDGQEILEVLRLIRNTANFSNTVFVCAYDHEYVAKTLGKEVEKPEAYIEKNFSMHNTFT